MKTLLINPMGTSPMVATEMYEYLKDEISDVILIYTDNKYVKAGTLAAKASLEDKFHAHVHLQKLDFDDIRSDNDMIKFIKVISETVKKEKYQFGTEKIIVNASGGRKIETIILSVYASIFSFDEVYNIINKSVTSYNEEYEKIKDKISEFDDENYKDKYKEYKDLLDHVFYPDMNDLYFLKVPVVKLPKDEINNIKAALTSSSREYSDLADYKLKSYKDSGFITYDNSRIYRTELGDIILSYLE
ncbi:hypothetical protein [Thermoplasma volcanium GSS1]|uniref:CRISPR system ring nuclease SSO2081-like domain-containing protein n=1 Tax=Thermoplasma volcanium (strain ATCC 51530 / DSM 4299 / JCM 9571 / NBRC 15438 / GSS1) TaxID=273116 RepID=Q97CJ5_THEVO|nr:CRISPR-associated protein Csx14 [Thermoplasma volcanium]BAB59248.1 hypothetical protein [Thermoplasma volcanium GSS1]